MRRWLLGFGICAAVGCGFDAVATRTFDGVAPDASGAEVGAGRDGAVPQEDGAADGSAPVDAEADRPDAGVVFAPSHIQPVYSLAAGDVAITAPSVLDTTGRTLALNGAAPAVSLDIVHSDGVAVWSVGALSVGARLTVTGDRPLVIVASRDVTLSATVAAFGELGRPGPGGAIPAMGPGKGGEGEKKGDDVGGGGGAGHGTAGAKGGDKGGAKGGPAGGATNAGGAVLVGGSGGGNGAGFALAVCDGRGRGGAGGGVIQISSIGTILVSSTGGVDVGGGGGAGGCKNNGGENYSGGGGGGAGGMVVLEAATRIEVQAFGTIAASGGGGGEGGENGSFGNPGEAGKYPVGIALGGFGTNGGNGGNGGVGGPVGAAPAPGASGDTGGGGGGATGRVFLRTRGAAALTVVGHIAAERTDDPTF